MMKAILRGSVLALLLVGVASEGRLAGLPGSVRSQGTVLEVAVPDRATVVRKQGKPSLTGKLTTFGEIKLTLAAGGYSETIPLNQVNSISFEGDVWIEGRSLPSRIRGYIKTWSGVPIKAFKLQTSAQSAQIDVNKVVKANDLQKIINNKEKVQVLSKISFYSPRKMTIQAFSMPKK